MSQTSTNAQIVAELQNMLVIFIRFYTSLARISDRSVTGSNITYSMTALVAYEYIITLEQEMAMVWHRKWTLATWLFIANRYALIGFIIWSTAPTTSSRRVTNCSPQSWLLNSCVVGYSCAPVQVMGDILGTLQNVVFAVFSALRVFALSDRYIPMTLLVLALNLGPVVLDIETTVFAADPLFGTFCEDILDFSARINFDLGDALVLAVTWAKTARSLAEGARIGMRTPLSTMLLRDGTIYFAVLLMMNIAQVAVETPSFQKFSFVTQVIQTLQPMLISRFLLNLHQVGSPEINSQEAFNSQFSVPAFRVPSLASIVGNMGEDLDHGGLAEEVEDEVDNNSGSVQAEEGAAPEPIIEARPSSMNPTPSTSRLIHIA
ncbi:hypothetical protein EW026_g6270 [Hermanssonia centrifuga]|uniref:DUF6533 domain-containing protein n=1 Tax=Hermanssonia centrifuga TaxID=98765 RepID=A0A4S4KBT6_9APHY|nr:hypothetical protein EW026_g6270 [Hermanssonia centrifuga]